MFIKPYAPKKFMIMTDTNLNLKWLNAKFKYEHELHNVT